MRFLALAHPRDEGARLRSLLESAPRPDLLLVAGAVGEGAAAVLRDLVVPVLAAPAEGSADPGRLGWPWSRPMAVAFDHSLRLLLFAGPRDERGLLDACLRYRATCALAPEGEAPVLRHAVERGCAVATLPDFAATGAALAIDNFFHSLQARRLEPGGTGRPAELSFFW